MGIVTDLARDILRSKSDPRLNMNVWGCLSPVGCKFHFRFNMKVFGHFFKTLENYISLNLGFFTYLVCLNHFILFMYLLVYKVYHICLTDTPQLYKLCKWICYQYNSHVMHYDSILSMGFYFSNIETIHYKLMIRMHFLWKLDMILKDRKSILQNIECLVKTDLINKIFIEL